MKKIKLQIITGMALSVLALFLLAAIIMFVMFCQRIGVPIIIQTIMIGVVSGLISYSVFMKLGLLWNELEEDEN